ncbi:MAG TPA: hypothetical protein VH044_05425 [Polyangiaceae bacterium]|nr:hypothetical protein [Polyangiaceae bacterium]
MQSNLPSQPSPSLFSIPPEDPAGPEPEENGSLVVRFGTAVGLGAAAALASALPAAMRLAVGPAVSQQSTGHIWAGLATATLVPMIGAVVVLRGAREGLRSFAGPGAELRGFGVALWVGSLFAALAFFGSVLRSTTHNHALAGATFAVGALLMAVADALVCVRVVAILRRSSDDARYGLALALGLFGFAVFGFMGMRFIGACSRDSASAAAAGMVVDVLAFGLAALFAARRSLASRRAIALVGPPVAVAVVALGFSALQDAPLRAAIDERAPAFAPVFDEVPGP